ncbi:hypothetical protein P3W45_001000 [Vairimorpha bombi]|jgi:xeroderma pigmentosum group C-complementing protein
MESDEGWEEVYKDDLNIIVDIKERLKRRDIKLEILTSLIKIFNEYTTQIEIPKINEFIDFNIIQKMYQVLRSPDIQESSSYYFTDYTKNIKYFKYLNEHKIFSRIYFVINSKKIESFLEIFVNNVIIKNPKRYQGCVFFIDSNSTINDYSWYFSTNMKNHSIFKEIFVSFLKFSKDLSCIEEFRDLDDERLKEIPTSLIKFKKHPIYCLESLLRHDQILSKKDICGFFRGEPVHLRRNIINLKSEKFFYRQGKQLKKHEKCLKVHNENNFYSEDQVENIIVSDMGDKGIQDFLHPNHIPTNCVYLQNEYDEIVCKKLKVKYRKCFVGFNRANPVYKGLFIYKKDLFLVSNFVFEYYDFYWKNETKNKALQIIHKWERLVKLCKKYTKLKERI